MVTNDAGFLQVDTIPVNQPVVPMCWKELVEMTPTREDHQLASWFLHPQTDSWRNGHQTPFMPVVWRQYPYTHRL